MKTVEEIKQWLGIINPEITTWEQLKEEIEHQQKPNLALLTDFYEFTMSQTFFLAGDQNKVVYFDVFFRSNPLKEDIPFMED